MIWSVFAFSRWVAIHDSYCSSSLQEYQRGWDVIKLRAPVETGGTSLLYLGTHPETSEPVMVKVLLPKYVGNQEMEANFLNEAKLIALADHPNIIKIYDYGHWGAREQSVLSPWNLFGA